jgi:hypothetical protein
MPTTIAPANARLADLGAGQRATARLVGVDDGTIRNDLGKRGADKSAKAGVLPTPSAEKSAMPEWFQADVDPSREAKRIARLERLYAALAARVDQLERERKSSALDLPNDAAFVARLAASTAGHAFNVAELRQHAAIDTALAADLHGLSNIAIGKRLRALAGREHGGFVLERVGRERGGAVWIVVALSAS